MSRGPVACAVLAAGRSARLGRPKQLIELDGRALVRAVAEEACRAPFEHVAVVLGAEAPAVAARIAGLRATVLLNPRWSSDGLASSLHAAVSWARASGAGALLVSVCDQPHLRARHLEALRACYLASGRPVASAYGGTRGVPAIFPASRFERLLAIAGDRGAASVLRGDAEVIELAWPEGAIDLDTPAEVRAFLSGSSGLAGGGAWPAAARPVLA